MNLNISRPPEWMEQAVCAQVDPYIFFPEKGESHTAAKKICAGCPVRTECADYCIANGEKFGVWGGRAAEGLTKLATGRSKQRPIEHGTHRGYTTHRRRGEQPCDDCTDANRIAAEERRARRIESQRAARRVA